MDDFFNNGNDNNEEKVSGGFNPSGEYHYIPPKEEQAETNYYNPDPKPAATPEPPRDSYQETQQSRGYGNYYNPPRYNPAPDPQPGRSYDFNETSANPKEVYINGEPVPGTKKKKNKTVIVIFSIIAIIVVIAIAGIIAGLAGYSSNESDSDNDTSVSQSDDSASAKVEDSTEAPKTDENGKLTAAGVAKKAMDSCVGITVYTQQSAYSFFYNYGQQQEQSGDQVASGEGSGVIMSESNGKTFIMTCAHVIADGTSFKVTLNNGKEYDASMVAYDSQTDIGVLSIDATGLQVASFGDSKDIEVGEVCIAIGCPGGLEFMNSVTQGIISALDRPVSSSIGYSNECIQVDAAINPGNSGGALFNMQGQVIGINSSKIASTEYEGMGFAVPSNTAVETANSLIKKGYVTGRARLGVTYASLDNYNNASSILGALEQKGFKDAKGTMVIQEIDPDSSLSGSKLQQYDMIVAVNGETLTSTDVMTSFLSSSKPGDEATLTIARINNNSIEIFEVKCKLIESKGN